MYTHNYLFVEFHNSKWYHIATKDNQQTLCSLVFALANKNYSEYADTNRPMPRLVNVPSSDRKLCKKCAEIQNKS